MVATLTRIFGTHNLELAEDVVQDTLLQACRQWGFSGIPDNPSAWLFKVAKNKALDKIRREKYTREYAADISHLLKSEYTASATLNELFLENEIRDDQLRMMFACCHPAIAQEAQVALTLKTLCGFGVAEIAKAFLTTEETISKRLYRAKEKLRELQNAFEIPEGALLDQRVGAVLSSVYLLFNEGYNSTQHDSLIREDLIEEAIRLAFLLAEHPRTDRPEIHALLALMLFHASRSKGRIDENGEIILLAQQDRSKWNRGMIKLALNHLDHSSEGETMTIYHLEAGIAYFHAMSPSYAETNWKGILESYNLLLAANPSPVIALNRAIIFAEVNGPEAGMKTMQEISGKDELEKFYLYHATIGDLYSRLGRNNDAKKSFEKAVSLTKSKKEIALLRKKMEIGNSDSR
ncbi:MAG: sigma-70 family RNA polymerase sigma factor [Bacteroidota bacterium]|nr:sigma-70 family RNA polymerase sigma factor [Bacteroidota bacterium]